MIKKAAPRLASRRAKRGARQTRRETTARAKNYSKQTKTAKQQPSFGANKLKVIVVGGNEEVGRNMTIFEYGQDIIIVDMGLQFPEEDMPGVDYIIPNTDYLKGKEKNVKGVIITHAHYDHIGGIPHIMKHLGNPPLFSSDLSIKMIEKRQLDFKDAPKLNSQIVNTDDKIKLGVFEIEFFGVSHNIPTSMGVIIKTPLGIIVHTGDFKLDMDVSGDTPAEIGKIAKLADKKVLALLSDSTNAPQSGHQLSELEIQGNLDEIIRNAPGRIIIGTFASLLGRIQQIIWAAEKFGKKIVIEGYSMKSNVEIAKELGYIKTNKGTLITANQMKDYPDNKILVLCTGAQGEGRAVLMRIANREHRSIKIEKQDTVVFSSSVIPGNERSVQKLKDSMYRLGANVIHYQMMDIHAGGHARKEDLKLLISLVRPQYFIPIEGNHSFLKIHAKIAEEAGIDPKKIFIADNGQVIEFTKTGGKLTNQKIPSDYVFVDGLGVGDISNVVLRDRQVMADDGMLVVIATVDSKTGKLIQSPDIISRGFIYMKESKKLVEQTRSKIKSVFKNNDPKQATNDTYIKDKIRNEIGQFLFSKTKRRPMVLPVIIEV